MKKDQLVWSLFSDVVALRHLIFRQLFPSIFVDFQRTVDFSPNSSYCHQHFDSW